MYTLAQKEALENALASGLTRCSYDGKTVEYRSLDDLRQTLAIVTAALNGRRRRRTFLFRTSADKGL